jgi:methylmalonyl-CoA mutase
MPVSFSEFDKASYALWLDALRKDLKSDDLSRITSLSTGGVQCESYLGPDQQQKALSIRPFRKSIHPEFAYANEWRKCVQINADDPLHANKHALAALKNGADSLCFDGIGITTQEELRLVLKEIIPEYIALNFTSGEGAPALLFMLADEFVNRGKSTEKLTGSIQYDILTDYAHQGSFPYSKTESFAILQAMLELSSRELPMFRNLVVNATLFHESGAEEADELAFILLVFQEYFEAFSDSLSPGLLANMARVRIRNGGDYFLSIAKTRAIRILWHMFLDAWNIDSRLAHLEIAAESCLQNKTIYDPYSNLIRSTIEGMSAVIGGADSLMLHPHDLFCAKPDSDSWRLALNVQHLLHDEAHLDKVCDPASGAWFIDQLTQKLVEKAWAQFNALQKQGSFSQLLEKGIVQEQIHGAAQSVRNAVRTRKHGIIGTSQFSAPGDAQVPYFQKRDPLAKPPVIKTITPFRAAEWYEQARYFIQKKKNSQAYLLAYGDPKMAGIRVDFCRDLLNTLGFSIHSGSVQTPAIDQIQSSSAHAADIIILCASNADYTVEQVKALKSVIGSTPIWIAGKCENRDELKKAGIDDFVFLGCDMELLFRNFLVQMVNSESYEA